MKTITSILVCSAAAFLVGCGGDTASTNDPQANQSKPVLKAPIADSAPSKISLSSTTEAPTGVTKGKKK